MADNKLKTTSSKSLDGNENQEQVPSVRLPKQEEARILQKLTTTLTESYQLVKQRQQKYNQLGTKFSESSNKSAAFLQWQEVCNNKNKLKRKKKLSASLTSVNDSVNQEKRTRIEGIQLNCRGRLSVQDVSLDPSTAVDLRSSEKLITKPPLPPTGKRDERVTMTTTQVPVVQSLKLSPPRLKRKLQENMQTIQKLNALTEQLRLEINELKSNLITERGAVRVLRAQNESETRKWKTETKKLLQAAELLKKNTPSFRKPNDAIDGNTDTLHASPVVIGTGSIVKYEIQRLTNEIMAVKEANKALEEKKITNCDADRRKAADIRELRDSYEIRLTQLTKSAKTEISRLLEELKTKERSIGQLNKELQLQNSRNATNTNTTTYKTKNKPQQKQPEKKQSLNKIRKNTNESNNNSQHMMKDINAVQNPNEMKKLKDLELINNTKNLQHNTNLNINTNNLNNNNLKHTTIKTFNSSHNSKLKIQEPVLEIQQQQELQSQCTNNNKNTITNNGNNMTCLLNNHSSNNTTKKQTTPKCENLKDFHSLPRDLLTERFIESTHNCTHEYRRGKVDNSDSDSALSSAPPSISPQPPLNGVEVTDIWQPLSNYSTNFEKLQKDLDLLHKENAELSEQLKLAKEQILESEKKMNVAANNTKLRELLSRIKYLEDQEYQLQAESQELREQNELLEFRILELEDTNDKWSQQNPASASCSPTHRLSTVTNSDVWACGERNENDPMALLFRNVSRNKSNMDMYEDPENMLQNSQRKLEERLEAMSPCDMNLVNHTSNEELRSRLCSMLTQLPLAELEKQCLQQMLTLLQNLDAISQRSGLNSLTTSSCDEPSSIDLVKSRISDYSSASSSSTPSTFNARSTVPLASDSHSKSTKSSTPVVITTSTASSNPRIVATVLPYNSSSASQHGPPNNTPTDSPRKSRPGWQCNSLSESGVFVESDFLSDAGENNVCTQTDFEEDNQVALFTDAPNKEASTELQHKLQQLHCDYLHSTLKSQITPVYGDLQRLQYYKERLELLESKLLIYESSGDLQAKRLADRLQREIELAKQVKDLLDRVDFLEAENATLEEEKCEFEEAENDTRLRLQRLEIELEILSQRNIELEMSREALSAKYKDCRSECLILRDDLSVGETQIRHLEEDKQKAKENLEFLHSLLPLLMVYHTIVAAAQQHHINTKQHLTEVTHASSPFVVMGNALCPIPESPNSRLTQIDHSEVAHSSSPVIENCQQRESHYLKEELKCLRHQIKELNSRHYEAMESADSHWVDLEREYKDREEAFRAKETCLKQKINRLQDCLRDDARAANEKILQLEDAEKELKCCLLRISKEHRDVSDEQQNLMSENERLKEQYEQLKEQQQPLRDSFEMEKKRNKSLSDELSFMRKLQTETECRNMQEMEVLRTQLFELKKEFLHIEVTNSELREEVCCLEQQVNTLQSKEKEYEDKICCLTDEVRNKEEMVSKLEKRLERSEGYSLAQELNGTPSKRFKREDVKDLHSASVGLGSALRNMKDCERAIPSAQKFQCVAREVKKLADTLLGENIEEEEEEVRNSKQDLTLTKEKTCSNIEQGKDLVNEDESVSVPQNPKTEQEPEPMDSQEVPVSVPQNPSTELELVPVLEPENNTDIIAMNPEESDARNGSLTVGMAIMPDFVITDTMLPSFSLASKKEICEVPSELRKLKDTRTLKNNNTEILEGLVEELDYLVKKPKKSKKHRKRNVRKRIAEIRHSTCKHTPMRRVFSCLNPRRPEVFHDASDIDIMQEEVLERYESFHSLRDEHSASHSESEEPIEYIKQFCVKKDASTETNPAKIDKETETTNRVESGIQVNDDIYMNQILDVIPPLSRRFLHTLHASTAETLNTRRFNEALRMRWEADPEFRQGLNTLQNLANVQQKRDNNEAASLENYENFVNAMSCLHILEEIYKPIKISLLQQIEDQINEQLMSFHSRQMESEFYCTVYYPVKRQVPLNITDFIMK